MNEEIERLLDKEIKNYLAFLMSQKGLSKNSIIAYEKDLKKFKEFLLSEHINFDHIKRYHFRSFLATLTTEGLSNNSINRIIACIKGFIRYKMRFGYKDKANILETESQRVIKKLPSFIFESEFLELISFKDKNEFDIRDKALLMLLFSTGMRVSEIVSLNLSHINNKNEIKIKGKGGKERFVFFGEKTRTAINNYLNIRSKIALLEENALFVNRNGKRLSDRGVRLILEKRINETSINKNISPHSLRHSFATLLIRNGASIRTVQELLGHSSIATTQKYTHLSIDELKDIVKKYHPHG